MNKPPILITLTSPTAAGKSYLFNYIRDVAKLPCFISTTTRAPRDGEVDGIDYYFISREISEVLESTDQFAELVTYNGARYGITKDEWFGKLQPGKIVFLIVEPSGIQNYVIPTMKAGVTWLKYFIHTDADVRMERFMQRMRTDVLSSLESKDAAKTLTTVETYMSRHKAMLTHERRWFEQAQWDRVLNGTSTPKENLEIILADIDKAIVQN
jgi:guanylate kinase